MAVRRLSFLFVLAVLLLPGRARAQTDQAQPQTDQARARSLWDQAEEMSGQGELAQAVRLLQRSYETWPLGTTACSLGYWSRALGRRPTAVFWLRRCAAAEEVPAGIRAQAADEVEFLEGQVGTLVLPAMPEGSRILVDEEEQEVREGQTEVLLIAGPHQVVLEEPSGRRWHEVVRGRPGERTRMEVPPSIEDRPATALRRYRILRATLWVALGTSLVLAVGTGVAVGYDVALSDRGDPNADQATLASSLLGGLTAVGLALVFALIGEVIMLRRTVRAPGAPSSGSTGASPAFSLMRREL